RRQRERAGTLLGERAIEREAGAKGDIVAIGVEGGAAAAAIEARGKVHGGAGGPAQGAAVERDAAGAEIGGGGEFDRAAAEGGAAGVGVGAAERERAGRGLGQRVRAAEDGGHRAGFKRVRGAREHGRARAGDAAGAERDGAERFGKRAKRERATVEN